MKTVRISVNKSRAKGWNEFISTLDAEISKERHRRLTIAVNSAARIALSEMAEFAPGPRLAAYVSSLPVEPREWASGVALSLSNKGRYSFEIKVSTDFYGSSVFNPAWGVLVTNFGRKAYSANNGGLLVFPTDAESASKSHGMPIEFNYTKVLNSKYGAGFGSPSRDYARFTKNVSSHSGTGWVNRALKSAHRKVVSTIMEVSRTGRAPHIALERYALGSFKGGGF